MVTMLVVTMQARMRICAQHRIRCYTKINDEESLLSWFAANGGSGYVAGTEQAGLRGLAVTRDVQVGAVLLDVPLTATLLDFSEQGAPLPGAAPQWSASLPSKVQLALLVLRERSRDSWAPFLQSWPSHAPALPEILDDLTLVREARSKGSQPCHLSPHPLGQDTGKGRPSRLPRPRPKLSRRTIPRSSPPLRRAASGWMNSMSWR